MSLRSPANSIAGSAVREIVIAFGRHAAAQTPQAVHDFGSKYSSKTLPDSTRRIASVGHKLSQTLHPMQDCDTEIPAKFAGFAAGSAVTVFREIVSAGVWVVAPSLSRSDSISSRRCCRRGDGIFLNILSRNFSPTLFSSLVASGSGRIAAAWPTADFKNVRRDDRGAGRPDGSGQNGAATTDRRSGSIPANFMTRRAISTVLSMPAPALRIGQGSHDGFRISTRAAP